MLVFDDDLRGFGLRVTSAGTKTFIFQYRRGSAVRRVKIGEYGPGLTPTQARRRAEELRGEVAGGADPAAARQAAIAAELAGAAARHSARAAEALTFAKLVDLWDIKRLVHRRPAYRREATRALRHSLPDFQALPAASIDTPAVRRALDDIRDRVSTSSSRRQEGSKKRENPAPPPASNLTGDTMSRRVRSYGRAMYSWAVSSGLVAGNPFAAVVVDSREAPRERVLSAGELREVWQAAGGLGWPWAGYLRMLLLTLQREAETAGMRWAELASDFSTWEVPGARTKNGRPHLVHLAEPARAILREAERIEGSALVFTTTGTTPVSGFSKVKRRLDAAIIAARAKQAAETGGQPAPLVLWRLHDFRRSGVTALAGLGVAWEVADKLLNHVQGRIQGVAAIYQRHEFMAEREAAMRLWADHLMVTQQSP